MNAFCRLSVLLFIAAPSVMASLQTYFPARAIPGIPELLAQASIPDDPRFETPAETFHPQARSVEFVLLQGSGSTAGYRLYCFPYSAVAHVNPATHPEDWHRRAQQHAQLVFPSLSSPARSVVPVTEPSVFMLQAADGTAIYSIARANPASADHSLVFHQRSRTLVTFLAQKQGADGQAELLPIGILAKPHIPQKEPVGAPPISAVNTIPPSHPGSDSTAPGEQEPGVPPVDGPPAEGAPEPPPSDAVPGDTPPFEPPPWTDPEDDFPIYPIPEPSGVLAWITILSLSLFWAGSRQGARHN